MPSVDGVEYFESGLMPGRPMFRCTRMSASLQVSSCAQMWRDANASGQASERLFQCRGCPVGAVHSGKADPTFHPLRGTTTCSRCHRGDMRLIGGNICVGCKNREYEWLKGRNAKGKFPARHPALDRRRLAFMRGGRPGVLVRELTASPMELVVELLRDSTQRVVFGLGIGRLYGAR